jgi:hypothetical protein
LPVLGGTLPFYLYLPFIKTSKSDYIYININIERQNENNSTSDKYWDWKEASRVEIADGKMDGGELMFILSLTRLLNVTVITSLYNKKEQNAGQ